MSQIPETPSEKVSGVVTPFPGPRTRIEPPRPTPASPAPRSNARSKLYRAAIVRIVQAADVALIGLIALLCAGNAFPASLYDTPVGVVAPFVAGGVLLGFGVWASDAYRFSGDETLLSHLGKTGAGLVFGSFLLALAVLPFRPTEFVVREYGIMILATTLAVMTIHLHAHALVRAWWRAGRLSRDVVIVGATASAQRLIERNRRTRELNILGVFEDRESRTPREIAGAPVLGDLDDLLTWPDLPRVEQIVVTVTGSAPERVRAIISKLRVLPNGVAVLLDLDPFQPERTVLAQAASMPLAFVSGWPTDEGRALAKRLQDLVLGVLILVLAALPMAVIAVFVKLDSPGPVIFRQRRHGFNNEVIDVFKFRTMRHEPQPSGPMRQVEENDPRVTRVGRFLRRTSLDEAPQIFNVLRGEMSLVGPRPHAIGMRTGNVDTASIVSEYAHRHRMKPGITGWAQVNGSRGPVHTAEDVRRRVALDIEYIDRQTFWFDLSIILRTLPCLLGDKENTR